MARSSQKYTPVGQNDSEDSNVGSSAENGAVSDPVLPPNPPAYQDDRADDFERSMEHFEFEDAAQTEETSKVERLKRKFRHYVVLPVRERITDPLAVLVAIVSLKFDYYLSKIGNPLILKRFVYVLFVSGFIYYVSTSGLLPNGKTAGSRGMFSDQAQLMAYAKQALDMSKMESDLEFISSMSHMAGTKGDLAVAQYIKEAFANNGLRLVGDAAFETYLNYPGNATLVVRSSIGENLNLDLTDQNFNPLSVEGEVLDAQLVYGHLGTDQDFKLLSQNGLPGENTILLMRYDLYPGEQVLRAQERGYKGIIFVSDGYGDEQIDSVQQASVHNFRISMGDPLSPGWSSATSKRLTLAESSIVPKIPTVPVSRRQGESLQRLLAHSQGAQFEDGWYSGSAGGVTVDFSLKPVGRKEHVTWSIVGKIEGREQDDKAIILSAARDSACTGCTYPNYGTATLLSLVQLFQQAKYKFGWKPLRNIYFISYDASEFGHAGATELLESESLKIREEIYALLDISQLGIDPDGQKLNIQSHPLLFEFFKDETSRTGFETNITHVNQYGDWSAYLTNGIPVAILSAPHILERKYPIYTCNDTFERFSKHISSDFWERSSELTLYVLQTCLRLIDLPMIPFDIETYVISLELLLQDLERSSVALELNFHDLVEALSRWKRIGERVNSWIRSWQKIVLIQNEGLEPSLLSVNRWAWNRRLSNLEKRHCVAQGLPNRSFYKNVLFGPTLKNQAPHDSWSFPGIRDAITDGDKQRAQDQISLAAGLLHNSAALLLDNSEENRLQ
ncbi:LAME_0H02410g1_1 [Lachancea meyersii CBS 8951]|uniref:LAME_0H02410g1_1 n=1 Tax=Lachancea meyersii CBS 8951 TaxID=1266667 RepID=A0A1G4KDK9_9SACH|nr:LAME_0H02410g1_1 [Lachancea meyersii CBS 8951]